MSDDLAAAYLRLLGAVGERAAEIGNRAIVSHWPFIGSNDRGVVVVGQGLKGWDAPEATARWHAEDAATPAGREAILEGTGSWAPARSEPMWVVLRDGWRRGSPSGSSRRRWCRHWSRPCPIPGTTATRGGTWTRSGEGSPRPAGVLVQSWSTAGCPADESSAIHTPNPPPGRQMTRDSSLRPKSHAS